MRGEAFEPELERPVEEQVGDDVLRLMFMCCHPVLSPQARVTLTLRMIGGLTTEEIARAYLTYAGDRRPADRQGQARARRRRPRRSSCRARASSRDG